MRAISPTRPRSWIATRRGFGRPAPWQVILAVGLAAAATLVVLHAANELGGDGALLALDSERGLAAWFSATQFYAAGAVGGALAFLDRRASVAWLVVGLSFLAFSVDDIVQVHEATESAADSRYSLLGLQPVVSLFVVSALVATSRRMDGAARRLLVVAAAALTVALGASIANGLLDDLPQSATLGLFGVEETAEMLMATLVIAAGADRAARLVRLVRLPARRGEQADQD
jgi:hypothetical protein